MLTPQGCTQLDTQTFGQLAAIPSDSFGVSSAAGFEEAVTSVNSAFDALHATAAEGFPWLSAVLMNEGPTDVEIAECGSSANAPLKERKQKRVKSSLQRPLGSGAQSHVPGTKKMSLRPFWQRAQLTPFLPRLSPCFNWPDDNALPSNAPRYTAFLLRYQDVKKRKGFSQTD